MRFLDIAISAAKEAGRVHKKYFQSGFKVKNKKSSYDLLTIADTEAEESAVSLIKKYFPGHNFIAEEFNYKRRPSGYFWVIDPLDGTNNFSFGLPIFCSSVALVYKNEVLAAAIYDVMRNELFYASKGKGAYLNNRPIRVSPADKITESLIITGFYYSRGKEMVETLEAIKRFHFKRVVGIRRLGAAALDLAYVACGRATGFWEFELAPWDFCAGKLLIEEAGGKVTNNKNGQILLKKKNFIVSSNGKIHNQMLEIINCKK